MRHDDRSLTPCSDCRVADAGDVVEGEGEPDAEGSADSNYSDERGARDVLGRHRGAGADLIGRLLQEPDEAFTLLEFAVCGGVASPLWLDCLQDNRSAQSDVIGPRDPGLQAPLHRSLLQVSSTDEGNHLRWLVLTTAGSATPFHSDSYGQVSCVMAYADGFKMVTLVSFSHTVNTAVQRVLHDRQRFRELADEGRLEEASLFCKFATYALRPGSTM
jgi:hypothetical protein